MMTPADLSSFILNMTPEKGIFGEHRFKADNKTLTYSEIAGDILSKKDTLEADEIYRLYSVLNQKDSKIKLNFFQDIISSIGYLFKYCFGSRDKRDELESCVQEILPNVEIAQRKRILDEKKRIYGSKSLVDLVAHSTRLKIEQRLNYLNDKRYRAVLVGKEGGQNQDVISKIDSEIALLEIELKKTIFTDNELKTLNEGVASTALDEVLEEKFRSYPSSTFTRQVLVALSKTERSIFYSLYIKYTLNQTNDTHAILKAFEELDWENDKQKEFFLNEIAFWIINNKLHKTKVVLHHFEKYFNAASISIDLTKLLSEKISSNFAEGILQFCKHQSDEYAIKAGEAFTKGIYLHLKGNYDLEALRHLIQALKNSPEIVGIEFQNFEIVQKDPDIVALNEAINRNKQRYKDQI